MSIGVARLAGTGVVVLAVSLANCASGGTSDGSRPTDPPTGSGPTAAVYVTTPDQGKLLSRDQDVNFVALSANAGLPQISIDPATRFQTVVGWGAAMTDASAYLFERVLNADQRHALFKELFGPAPGIGLNFVRITMGASDFSQTDYSYDDMPAGEIDTALTNFSIDADRPNKIPALKEARAVNPAMVLFGSPWSPPGWMKTTGSLIKGTLRPEFYPAFAQYFAHWIEAYQAEGLPITAVTLQNEPHYEPDNYPGMLLEPAQRADVIKNYVGPLFARRGITAHIWDWDHNWDDVNSPLTVLGDAAARPYVAGIAWHCYAGDISAQLSVHQQYPDKETYFTECSGGDWAPVWADNLKWYVSTMVIKNARTYAKGVALWNLALDENAGPHLGGCGNCRGIVTINSKTGQVTRNVEYYALAHASRFARPGATRIESTAPSGLETVAFQNADDQSKVLIVLNDGAAPASFVVKDGDVGGSYTLPGGAVATFVWK
jgi:glucosylceramidase